MRKAVIAAIAAGVVAIGGWVYAQAQVPLVPFPTPGNNTILTGPDVGIRIDGTTEGRVFGTLMVRAKDGSWLPVQLGRGGVHRLDTN